MSFFACRLEIGHWLLGSCHVPSVHAMTDCPHSTGGPMAQRSPLVHGSPRCGRFALPVGGPSKQCHVFGLERSQQFVVMPASGSQGCWPTGYEGQNTPHEQLAPSYAHV